MRAMSVWAMHPMVLERRRVCGAGCVLERGVDNDSARGKKWTARHNVTYITQ